MPLRIEIAAVLDVIHCRAVQIGTAADKQRHRLRNRLHYFAAGFARGQFRILGKIRNLRQEIGRHFSREAVIEQLRFVGVFRAPSIVSFFPAIILSKQCLFVLGEIVVHIFRREIMLVRQAERLAGCIDEFCARFAVRLVCPCDFGNAFSD